MAATNYTPIQHYRSATAAAVPSAGALQPGELAINYTDGKLFYKDNAGAVQTIGIKNPVNTSGTGATGTWGISVTGSAASIVDGAVSTSAKIASSVVSPEKLTQPFTQGTVKPATGTAVDFTGIPSWVKRITVMFSGVSTYGFSNSIEIRIGSGSVDASGYTSSTSDSTSTGITSGTSTTGFRVGGGGDSSSAHGMVQLCLFGSNTWVCSGSVTKTSSNGITWTTGSKTLSGTLDRIRITTTGGDTFDAGSFNILYE